MVAPIQSSGDLEVIALYEAHGLLASIIGPDFYKVHGEMDNQTVVFHDRVRFRLFLILAQEFFAEGSQSSQIEGKKGNWSILSSLEWLVKKHPIEASNVGLEKLVAGTAKWADDEVPFEFWCGALGRQFDLQLTNRDILSFAANIEKHGLFRLSSLLKKLSRLFARDNQAVEDSELVALLEEFSEAAQQRLFFSSHYLLESLGVLLFSLNRFVINRFARNPTNIGSQMDYPADISSDAIKDLYGSTLVFKRYTDARIREHTPIVSSYFRKRNPPF